MVVISLTFKKKSPVTACLIGESGENPRKSGSRNSSNRKPPVVSPI